MVASALTNTVDMADLSHQCRPLHQGAPYADHERIHQRVWRYVMTMG